MCFYIFTGTLFSSAATSHLHLSLVALFPFPPSINTFVQLIYYPSISSFLACHNICFFFKKKAGEGNDISVPQAVICQNAGVL